MTAALVLLSIAAAAAQAAVTTFPAGRFAIGSPQPAGSATVWAEPTSPGYRIRLRAGERTSTVREVRRGLVTASVIGSPQALMVQEWTVLRGRHGMGDQLLDSATLSQSPAGGGPFIRRGPGCLIHSPDLCGQNSALDGTNAIVPDPSEASFRSQVVSVSDSSVERVIDGVGSPVSIAGSKLAWLSPNGKEVVVYDWRMGSVLYRVPFPPDAESSGYWRVAQVAVRSDGTVGFGYPVITKRHSGLTSGLRYGWASPAQPSLHLMPIDPTSLGYGPLQFHGDDLVYTRRPNDRPGAPLVAYAAPLGGRPHRLLTGSTNEIAIDGERVTWSERTCSGVRIASAAFGALAQTPLDRTSRCPLRLARPPRMSRKGDVILEPRCEGFERRCASAFELLAARSARRYGRGRLALRRGSRVVAGTTYAIHGSRLEFPLTRAARRQLRRHRHLRIMIRAAQSFDSVRTSTVEIEAR